MKILHYIDDFHPIRLHNEYFELLAKGLKEGDELHLLMPKADEPVKIEGVQVHYLSYFRWMTRRNRKMFFRVMDELSPDILHIHACWSRHVADLLKWNDTYYKRPYIFSPHKCLLPWHNQRRIKRALQARFYQNSIIANADVVVTDSEQENNIQTNKQTVTIKNALYANGYSIEQMQEDYSNLLHKLSNSRPYLFMNGEERKKEAELLRYAVTHSPHGDNEDLDLGLDEMENNQGESLEKSPNFETYKRIALHALNEGTFSIMKPFLPRRVIELTEETPRFIYNTKKNTDSLYSLRTLAQKSTIASVVKEEKATEDEAEIIKQIVNVQYEIVHNTISQRHLIELYKTMRYCEYNEDTLNAMLHHLGNFQDAARLMQLLKDYYGLEEGFMPMQPLDDKLTRQIKNKLLLWQIQG